MLRVSYRGLFSLNELPIALKLYSLSGEDRRVEATAYLGQTLLNYPAFFREKRGMATTYPLDSGKHGTTIRIFDELEAEPDNCVWRTYNAEDGVLLEPGEAGLCNKEMRIFGREADLMEELGFDVPRWMHYFAWEIGK